MFAPQISPKARFIDAHSGHVRAGTKNIGQVHSEEFPARFYSEVETVTVKLEIIDV